MTMARKSYSSQDYPEHLNPFYEEDNHNKIRFWTIGRKLNRSNSISFNGIKDLKNSWAFRSFMRKGKKQPPPEKPKVQENGESESPVVFRRALQYSSVSPSARKTVGSPERYVYGGSVTPLPRSRFQERMLSSSQQEVNSSPRMARSEISGSRFSVESTNPFEEGPVAPARTRRKKKRAPLPPTQNCDLNVSVGSENLELHINETNKSVTSHGEEQSQDLQKTENTNLNVELKIVEDDDDDVKVKGSENTEIDPKKDITVDSPCVNAEQNGKETDISEAPTTEQDNQNTTIEPADSDEDILNKVAFSKINIVKYRRNSSVNEDDIKLRRGNLEDFHVSANKRSKSLTNALDTSYVTYDINLNEDTSHIDANGNEEPQKVICKLYDDDSRKQSIDNSISSTEREFNEIDKATREFEMEIRKLTTALVQDVDAPPKPSRLSVSDIRKKFDGNDATSPNPIPKPRRSYYGDIGSPVNGNIAN